ncbi:hypothetical protein F-VV10_0099 [Faustovirus]|nr:hypothetical protein F-VV10_0099 [Faustovirus]
MQSQQELDDAYIAGFGSVKVALGDLNDRVKVLEKIAEDYAEWSNGDSDGESNDDTSDGFIVVNDGVNNEEAPKATPSYVVKSITSPDSVLITDKTLDMATIRKMIDESYGESENKIGAAIDYVADKLIEVRDDVNDRIIGLRNSIDDGLQAQSDATRENLDNVTKLIAVTDAKVDNARDDITGLNGKLRELADITYRNMKKLHAEVEKNREAARVITEQTIKIGEVLADDHKRIDTLQNDGELIEHLVARYSELLDEIKAIKAATMPNGAGENHELITNYEHLKLEVGKLQRESDDHLHATTKSAKHIVELFTSIKSIHAKINDMAETVTALTSRVATLYDENTFARQNALNNTVVKLMADHEALATRVDELTTHDDVDNDNEPYYSKLITDPHIMTMLVVSKPTPRVYRLSFGDRTQVPVDHTIIERYSTHYIHKLVFNVPARQPPSILVMREMDGEEWDDAQDNIISTKIEMIADEDLKKHTFQEY